MFFSVVSFSNAYGNKLTCYSVKSVFYFSKGYALPVIHYIRKRWEAQDTDLSLIRYFVMEIIEIVSPPYSAEFVEAFLPLVEGKRLLDEETLSDDKKEGLKQFISDCAAVE